MSAFRQAWALLRKSGRAIFLFEAVYKMAAAALFLPLFNLLFGGLMRLTGIRYLTAENLAAFVFHPLSLLLWLVLVAAVSLYTLVDIGVVVWLLRQETCSIPAALRQVFTVLRRGKKLSNLWMLLHLPLLALGMHLGVGAALMATVRIPLPISAYLTAHPLLPIGAGIALLAGSYWGVRWIYAVVIHVLEGLPFLDACRRSSRLSRGRRGQLFLRLLGTQCALIVFYALLALAGILVIRLISASLARSFLTSHVLTFLTAALLVISMLSIPLNYALIYAFYRQTGQALPETCSMPEVSDKRKRLRKLFGLLALALSLAGCLLILYRFQRGHYNLSIEHLRVTEITGHRGASKNYPENTMAAFAGAWEDGADWIELDVQQSRDGVIFCMHDSSFQRTAGLRKNAWELTWEEISQLDAGSFLGPEHAGEPIPTLAEAVDFARWHHIRLNIELKPTGRERDFEQAVVDIIREYGFEDDCVITSQKYAALERVKAIAPEIETVYVMPVAIGNIEWLTAADHFSVSYHFISRGMVSRIHQAGKQIYAWTVNRRDIMERMIDLGVDNIITDNVALARQCVSADAASELVATLLDEIAE